MRHSSKALIIACGPVLVAGSLAAAPVKPKAKEPYRVRPSSTTVKNREAILALGQTAEAGAAAKLIAALDSRDAMARVLAVQGLGLQKVASARARLAGMLANDPAPEVREAAAVSLLDLGDPQAVSGLIPGLKDSAAHVRISALNGLARYRDAKARPAVEALWQDPSPEVRRTMVYTLGRLEDRGAVPVLEKLLGDSDAAVKAGAAQALGELRSAGSIPALLPLLNSPEKVVQASAARTLMMMGEKAGFETAKSLAADADMGVRLIAVDALGWSKDPAAEAELQSLLNSAPADTRPAVQEALNRTTQLRKQQ